MQPPYVTIVTTKWNAQTDKFWEARKSLIDFVENFQIFSKILAIRVKHKGQLCSALADPLDRY